jgi:very-short-patch-repair endonuclease
MKRRHIGVVAALADSHGGRLLSTEYVNDRTPLEWECAAKHTWWGRADNIQQGKWCPFCAGNVRTSYETVRAVALGRSGRLLSGTYVNKDSSLTWECSQGHTWDATYRNVKAGKWCAICSGNARLNISQLSALAQARDGRLISTEYVNGRTKLKWECARLHTWDAIAESVKNAETWCARCGGRPNIDIDEVRALAISRGGLLLTTTYRNAHTMMLWQCAKTHPWKATYNAIQQGKWCPICVGSRGERMARRCFEYIVKREFPQSRTKWLGKQHLDGFCQDLMLAFEYDGEQHVVAAGRSWRTKANLVATQERDRRKDELCLRHGVTLVRIPEVKKLTEAQMLRAVVNAIRTNPAALAIIRSQGSTLPRKVTPQIISAINYTGTHGFQLFMPGSG